MRNFVKPRVVVLSPGAIVINGKEKYPTSAKHARSNDGVTELTELFQVVFTVSHIGRMVGNNSPRSSCQLTCTTGDNTMARNLKKKNRMYTNLTG